MPLKRRHEEEGGPVDQLASTEIYVSSPIEDRASSFVAHFSPSVSAKTLQAQGEFESASHRIAAWRKPSSQKSLRPEQLYNTGHDDDGENWAGKRLEKLLTDMNVEGAAVVARWYGGILLGPVRFNHIESCAREAIQKYLDSKSRAKKEEESLTGKRARVEPDPRGKLELAEMLAERDQTIEVLRGLLKDKQTSRKTTERLSSPDQQSTPDQRSPIRPSYDKMTVEQLLRVEKARDATIGFLLKQIDAAEQEQTPETHKRPQSSPEPDAGAPDKT
jgi:hypothetical protein